MAYYPAPHHGLGYVSENAHSRAPSLVGRRFRVDNDLVGEGVRVGSGDGWNVVLVTVDDADDLVCSLLEGFCHGAANLEDIYTGYVSVQLGRGKRWDGYQSRCVG